MRNKFHKNLTLERWQKFSKETQILNIAAEFSRAKNWLIKKDENEVLNCLDRSFELIDLTVNDSKWKKSLKELLRFRDVLAGFYIKKNKNLDEFIKIFQAFLNFNKFSSQVEI
jgi:hypothetical protein